MGEERFAPPRGRPAAAPAGANPSRGANLGPLPDRPPRPALPPEAAAARTCPPILERFRAMLKEREEDLRGPEGENDAPSPSVEEIVPMYEEVLAELTFNSKPIITELTIIAGDQREFGEGIADAICSRIVEVPVEQKLPCLYLLDSIVKNIGREYVRHFAARLPEVFCEAYTQVPPNLHPAMRHLFKTWSQVFPPPVLREIENELQFSSPQSQQSPGSGSARHIDSPSPRPAHGIHVNPKYLEAQRQINHSIIPEERDPRIRTRPAELTERNLAGSPKGWSGASSRYHDIRHSRETASGLDALDQKSSSKYDDFDLDHPEGILQSGSTKKGPVQVSIGCSSALVGNGKALPFPKPSSPEAGLGRVSERSVWLEPITPDDTLRQPEAHSSYDIVNEISKNRPRELIDAYGNSKGKNVLSEKPSKVQRLDSNGLSTDLATKKWQNSEEEEYVWEDMSPTLADRSRSNSLLPYDANVGSFGLRTRMSKPDASILDADFRRSSWSIHAQPPLDLPPAILGGERVHILGPGHRLINKGPQNSVERNELSQFQSSQITREPWKSHYAPPQSLSPRSLGKIVQTPFLAGRGGSTIGQRLPPFRYAPEADLPFQRPSSAHSEPMNSDVLPSVSPAVAMEKLPVQRPSSPPVVPAMWPPAHKPQALPPFSVQSQQKHFAGQLSSVNSSRPMMSQGPHMALTSPWQPSDAFDRKPSMVNSMSHQNSGLIPMSLQNQSHAPLLCFQSQESHGSIAPSGRSQIPTHAVSHSVNQAQGLGAGAVPSLIFSSSLSGPPPSSLLLERVPDNSFNMHGGPPPLPPGPPPAMSQIEAASSNSGSLITNPPGSGFSGLISSLMSQGLISLAPQTTVQDSIGTEFNPDLLKVRHEFAISDLYVTLPRQCTTCGLRFKCQEEHSSHMDWHVTKNRMSKNRKQKPSRKWFVSAKEWLSGAETLGADAVPGFLPSDTVVDKTEEKELSVPADEGQNLCALCGEPFEDFYSDEADEWMYKGAVYLNAPTGSTEGLERSQLGPIVHAKCRSESTGNQGQV